MQFEKCCLQPLPMQPMPLLQPGRRCRVTTGATCRRLLQFLPIAPPLRLRTWPLVRSASAPQQELWLPTRWHELTPEELISKWAHGALAGPAIAAGLAVAVPAIAANFVCCEGYRATRSAVEAPVATASAVVATASAAVATASAVVATAGVTAVDGVTREATAMRAQAEARWAEQCVYQRSVEEAQVQARLDEARARAWAAISPTEQEPLLVASVEAEAAVLEHDIPAPPPLPSTPAPLAPPPEFAPPAPVAHYEQADAKEQDEATFLGSRRLASVYGGLFGAADPW